MKQIARAPLAAHRRTSAAASWASHIWTMIIGTNIPGGPPGHHSSRMKSFQAFTQTSASSLSLNELNSRPPKRGSVGKQMLARTPCDSMSLARSFGS